jgi:hypothetical protein
MRLRVYALRRRFARPCPPASLYQRARYRARSAVRRHAQGAAPARTGSFRCDQSWYEPSYILAG